ncbi:MAG: hypothetical protein RR145_03490, partial [Oscillospiraceae bacterium]
MLDMTIKKNGFERNMILYVSIILIVLIVYSGISYYNTVRIAREQLDLTNKAVLRQVKSNTETSLYNIERLSFRLVQDNLVNSFVDEKVADSFSKFKLQEMLNSSIISDDFIDSIYIYSEASGEVITTSTFCNIENLHDISWLEEYKNLNQPYIVFSRYIDNGKGKGEELVLTLVRNISMFTGGN